MIHLGKLLDALAGQAFLFEEELVPAFEIVGDGGHPGLEIGVT